MDKILVTSVGVLSIGFIYWFFFGKKEEVISGRNIKIIVEGGYKPSVIKLQKGKTAKITFLRKDKNSCLEEVVLSDFKIRKYLPMNKPVYIEVTPTKQGEFPFQCGMNMFHGKIIVK